MRLTTEEKIRQVIEKDMLFLVQERPEFEYYSLKSVVSGKVYQIFYKRFENKYKCDCGNIRNNDCWHIKAVQTLQGETVDIEDRDDDET